MLNYLGENSNLGPDFLLVDNISLYQAGNYLRFQRNFIFLTLRASDSRGTTLGDLEWFEHFPKDGLELKHIHATYEILSKWE
jgi:hypothetical protein